MSAADYQPIGRNHNRPPEPVDPAPRFTMEQIMDLGLKMVAAGQRHAYEITAPIRRRKAQLARYRRHHKAELRQRQREYRYYKSAENLERDLARLTPRQYEQRQRGLRAQYLRMMQGG